MKIKLNTALEGTCSGNVAGGLLSWAGEKPSSAFVLKGGYMEKNFHIRGLNQFLSMNEIKIPADEWLIDLGKEIVELEEEQQALENQAIKAFPAGVISYSLFDDIWHYYQAFMGRLDLLTECAYETRKHEEVMDLICQIIEQGQKESEPFWDRALSENKEAGGNGVVTINPNTEKGGLTP